LGQGGYYHYRQRLLYSKSAAIMIQKTTLTARRQRLLCGVGFM
jgi:hypothetical protein